MSTLRDALKKSGKFSEQIRSVEEKEKQEQRDAEANEKEEFAKRDAQIKIENIDRDEYTKIAHVLDDLQFERPNFLFHLLCAHIPLGKGDRVVTLNDKETKCCLCGQEIISLLEVIDKSTGILLDSIKIDIEQLDSKDSNQLYAIKKKQVHEKHLGKKLIGYSSKETRTVICAPCYRYFISWIENNILFGNKFVNSAIRKVRGRRW